MGKDPLGNMLQGVRPLDPGDIFKPPEQNGGMEQGGSGAPGSRAEAVLEMLRVFADFLDGFGVGKFLLVVQPEPGKERTVGIRRGF